MRRASKDKGTTNILLEIYRQTYIPVPISTTVCFINLKQIYGNVLYLMVEDFCI